MYVKSTEEIVILSSRDDETSSVTSTATEDNSVITISSDEQSDTEDGQQSGSSLLNSILTPDELKLLEPLPETDESDEDEAIRRINALSVVKTLTKKRRGQKSISQITITLKIKLKLNFE